MVQGFPDTQEKLDNVTRAWARFMSLDPYHVKLNPSYERLLSPEDLAEARKPFAWKEGIIPGEWLIQKIQDTCEWFPAPIVAREIYCGAGWPPADGQTLDMLPTIGRRRTEPAEVRPADTEVA